MHVLIHIPQNFEKSWRNTSIGEIVEQSKRPHMSDNPNSMLDIAQDFQRSVTNLFAVASIFP